MWLTFLIAAMVCLVLLYAPGFLFCKGFGFDSFRALICAPLVSVACFSIMGIALAKLGFFCTWAGVAIPSLVICAIPFFVRLARTHSFAGEMRSSKHDWGFLALYLIVGIVLATAFFLLPLDTPNSFVQEYDNVFHVSVIRGFVDSGTWSMLDVSKYMVPADHAIDPRSSGGFYPAAWHIMGAMMVSMFGVSAAFAENLTNFLIISILFPSAMLLFLRSVFKSRRVLGLGAACVLAFVPYPWVMCIWGPLFPNMFALALAPAAASIFMLMVKELLDHEPFWRTAVVFVMACVALVLSQPNTVFFCIVLLTPYCVYRLWTKGEPLLIFGHAVSCKLAGILFVCLVLVIWACMFFAPALNELTSYNWDAEIAPGHALRNALTYDFRWYAPQTLLGIIVIVGIVYTIIHREYLWLVFPYLFFFVAYVLSASTEGFVKHFIAGFWYTDPFRAMGCMAIVGIPLAALGLHGILCLLDRPFRDSKLLRRACTFVIVAAFCIVNYAPGIALGGTPHQTGHGMHRNNMVAANNAQTKMGFDLAEREFVEKVKKAIPADALVINMPDDGSAFAYGVYGLRTYYRDYAPYVKERFASPADAVDETYESQTIRLFANEVADNQEVRDALKAVGAQYLLFLDYGHVLEKDIRMPFYDPELWVGLSAIDENTPGYELVLSEDDMRLFKISPDMLDSGRL